MKFTFICSAILGFCILFQSCMENDPDSHLKLSFSNPTVDSIQLFAEGIISTSHNERDMAVSPKGDEIFYTLVSQKNTISVIVTVKMENGKWSQPETASFSGRYPDLEPAFSPDGQKLFFASKRPAQAGDEKKDYDLWYADRMESGWSEPKNVGQAVNTTKDEYYPSVSSNGNLYFTSSYEDAYGLEDIYLSKFESGKYLDPVRLDSNINSAFYEFNAWVSPDESRIIYSSYGRADGFGGGDLYISEKNAEGNWKPAKNLGEPINSPALDYCPFVDFEGKFFYFTSDRSKIQKSYKTQLKYTELIHALDDPLNGTGNIFRLSAEKVTFD